MDPIVMQNAALLGLLLLFAIVMALAAIVGCLLRIADKLEKQA